MTDQTKGLLLTFLGVMCIVPEALFVRVIDAPMLTLAFWKVTLVGLAIGTGLLAAQGTAPFRALRRAGWASAIYVGGVACAGVGFVLAVRLTSVANVVFILASLPVFAAIYSRVFLGEPISRRMFLTIAAVLAGLAVIAFGSGETENASRAGDLLALAISAIFAGALTAARHARAVSMVPAVALAYLLAGLVLLPVAQPLQMPSCRVAADAALCRLYGGQCWAHRPRAALYFKRRSGPAGACWNPCLHRYLSGPYWAKTRASMR